ncbi:MAG: GNAT family N-acetyltransferase [Phycisphaerales bacterium]
MTRYFMVADLTTLDSRFASNNPSSIDAHASSHRWRTLIEGHADAEALAVLMLNSYRGSIDDAGETIVEARSEVAKLLGNEYGMLDRSASLVCDEQGQLASATIITRIRDVPFLAFSMTAPPFKRQGLARTGLTRVMTLLAERGERSLRLMVTKGNTPAETLYTSLGFVSEKV